MLEKIINKIKNREFIIIMFLACVAALGCILMVKVEIEDNIPTYATHMGHEEEEQFIYYLTDDDVIIQEFTSPQDFDMITLHFSSHDQRIPGKTFISIIDKETEEIVCYEEKPNEEIDYTKLVELELSDIGQADRNYILTLRFEGMGDKGLGIFGFPVSENRKPALVSDTISEYEVAIGTHTYTTEYKKLVARVVLIMICILIISAILVSATNLSEEYLFLGIALPVGVAFLMFVSVNVVHDGGTHLATVYHYSNVLLGQSDEDVTGYVKLRTDEAQAFRQIYENYNRENNVLGHYWDTVEHFWDKGISGEWELSHEYGEQSASSILEYFPAVFGMTFGRIIGGSARFNILLVKIFCFLFYVGMVFWAIKITPCFKTVIAFAALLPMSMYQATGITYDTTVMAVSMVIIALFFKARSVALNKREIITLFVLSMALGCCKGGFYLLLLLLFFTIPSITFGSKKSKYKVCVGSLVCGGIGLTATVWNSNLASYLKGYFPFVFEFFEKTGMLQLAVQVGCGVPNTAVYLLGQAGTEIPNVAVQAPQAREATYGIAYAFENLIDFFKMFCVTMVHEIDRYVGSLVGYRMAWTDDLVNWVVIFAFLGLLWMASSSVESERMKVNPLERVVCAGLVIIEAVAFHILMLLETPVGDKIIKGVQGRYFLAWVPIIMFIAYNGNRKYTAFGKRRLFFYFSVAEVAYLYLFLKIFLGIA